MIKYERQSDLVEPWLKKPGGCFTNVSRALQNNLAKIYSARNHIYGENFKPKLCTCAQSMALGTRTKFRLEILIRSTISVMQKFRKNILESSPIVSETPPRHCKHFFTLYQTEIHLWQLYRISNMIRYRSFIGPPIFFAGLPPFTLVTDWGLASFAEFQETCTFIALYYNYCCMFFERNKVFRVGVL